MITFKNRYAEYDNLIDTDNDSVFRNCYHKEYRRNFFGPSQQSPSKKHNFRYSLSRYNNDNSEDNSSNNNNIMENVSTPLPNLPKINNSVSQNQIYYRNMPTLNSNNYSNYGYPSYKVSTPVPNLPYINDDRFNNNNYNNLNYSNDYSNYLNYSNNDIYKEIDEIEKEQKLMLEQEKLNQINFELKILRQKRKAELERRLEEEKLNRIREEQILDTNRRILENLRKKNRKRNYHNLKFNNFHIFKNKSLEQNILEESLKNNVMTDRLEINGLIDEINRMKVSQYESNLEFQKKMDDLKVQNDIIRRENQIMLSNLKDMKYKIKEESKDNNDYFIEEIKNKIKKNNNLYSSRPKGDEQEKTYNYYLSKKDNSIYEFNDLNKNLISDKKNVVVTPLIYKSNFDRITPYNNKYYNRIYDKDDISKDKIYSIFRKSNDRLQTIKKIEDNMMF